MHLARFLLFLLLLSFSLKFYLCESEEGKIEAKEKEKKNEEREVKYDVEFVSTTQRFSREDLEREAITPADEVEMVSPKDGKKYLCRIPKGMNEEDREKQKQKEKEEVENADMNVEKLLAPLFEHCLYRIAGWWTYEFCPGKHFRQYHEEKSAIIQEFFLGRGPTTSSLLVTNSPHISPPESAAGGSPSLSSSPSYFKQVYEDGTPCDLTQEGRRIEVQYHCNYGDNKLNLLTGVKEPATCQYQAIVETPLLCSHPLFRPKTELSDKVVCYPLL